MAINPANPKLLFKAIDIKKSGKLPEAADLQVEEEVISAVIQRETRYQLRRRVYNQLAL